MISRRAVIEGVISYLGARDYVLVDDIAVEYARHVCPGGNNVWLLPHNSVVMNTPEGEVTVHYYICTVCGKVFICKNFI